MHKGRFYWMMPKRNLLFSKYWQIHRLYRTLLSSFKVLNSVHKHLRMTARPFSVFSFFHSFSYCWRSYSFYHCFSRLCPNSLFCLLFHPITDSILSLIDNLQANASNASRQPCCWLQTAIYNRCCFANNMATIIKRWSSSSLMRVKALMRVGMASDDQRISPL